jgi:hypothetical protein
LRRWTTPFKGFDINSIFRKLLIRIDIYPVGTKHLSRYFGLPYDPLSLYILAMTMQLLAIRHGVKTPSGNHGIYYSTKTRQYYLVGGSFDIESKRFDYITARLGREELAVSVREAIESLRGRPRWGEYIA